MTTFCTVSKQSKRKKVSDILNPQKTLNCSISISGVGLFTGEKVSLKIHPADPGVGIVFQRTDLLNKPAIAAKIENVVSTPRCTILGREKQTIHTVEHLLSALKGLGVDNAWIEINGPEIPIMDGSAAPFVTELVQAGLSVQEEERRVHFLSTPICWAEGDIQIIALPAKEYRISYTLHYPKSSAIGTQFFSTLVTPELYTKEIAPSRTFCVYEEIAPLFDRGLIRGGGPNNSIIVKENKVVNQLRYPDEMVRHKILDLIGDLSLVPMHFVAHVIAIRSGHTSNIEFGKQLLAHFKREIR